MEALEKYNPPFQLVEFAKKVAKTMVFEPDVTYIESGCRERKYFVMISDDVDHADITLTSGKMRIRKNYLNVYDSNADFIIFLILWLDEVRNSPYDAKNDDAICYITDLRVCEWMIANYYPPENIKKGFSKLISDLESKHKRNRAKIIDCVCKWKDTPEQRKLNYYSVLQLIETGNAFFSKDGALNMKNIDMENIDEKLKKIALAFGIKSFEIKSDTSKSIANLKSKTIHIGILNPSCELTKYKVGNFFYFLGMIENKNNPEECGYNLACKYGFEDMFIDSSDMKYLDDKLYKAVSGKSRGDNLRLKLSSYGNIELLWVLENSFELKITDGFSGTLYDVNHITNFIKSDFPEYKFIKSAKVDTNLFHCVLIKSKDEKLG